MKLCKLMLIGGVAIATAIFPAMAQQAQRPSTEDHSAHHGGTDQQTGQSSPSDGMMGGMMGGGQQGMMGSGMSRGVSMCPMMEGMMGSAMQSMMGSVGMGSDNATPDIKIANVVEQDTNTVAADIVTRDKDGLVHRYAFDRQTGLYRPVQ